MALGDMVVRIVGDNSQFDNSLSQTEKKFKAFSDSMGKFGKSMTVFVTAPILAAGVAAVKSAGDMEMYQAAFETMLGSADKAKTLLEDMRDFAAATPFSMTDLADASKTLLQFGINGDEVLDVMKMLGDAAQGNGQRFSQLALVYGQISSTGRLMGQDLLQLINAGFNPLQVISEKTGRSMSDLKDAMSKGKISAQQITEAFKIATSEGGMFFGGMQKASQTLPGLMSTLGDDVATLGRSFAEILLPAIKDIVKSISGFVQGFTSMDESSKKAILAFAGIAAAAGPLILAIKAIGTAFTTSTGPIGAAVALVGLLVAYIVKLIAVKQEQEAQDKLLLNAEKGLLKSSEEYQAAIDVQKKKLDDMTAVQTAATFKTKTLALEQKKAADEAIKNNENVGKSYETDFVASLSKANTGVTEGFLTARNAANQLTGSAKAAYDQEAARLAKITERYNTQKKKEEELAEAERKRNEALVIAQIAEQQRLLKIAQLEAEKISRLEEMRKTLEENSLTEEELIQKEMAQLKECGATDEEVMAYMKIVHKDYYDKETENIEKLKAEQAAATAWARDFDAKERADIEKNLKEIDEYKEDLHKKELDRIEKEAQAYYSVTQAMLRSLSGLLSQYSEYKLSLYDKDSDEYKAAALEQFNIQKGLSAVNAAIAGAEAAVNAYKALSGIPFVGPALGLAAAIAIGGFTAAQVGFILAQQPPALAEGGIAPALPGGRQYTLGEGGQPEAVIPLDRLDDMLDRQDTGDGGQALHASFYLDRRLIFEDFYTMTKNHELLVDGGAIVGKFQVQ